MIVKKLRTNFNWSQEQLAEMCGLSVRTIQRVESGNKASLETLKSLASVFEIDIKTLTVEITVIDKKSEEWKKLPWVYRANMWGINNRKSLLRGELFMLIGGILALLVQYDRLLEAEFFSAPIMILSAYFFGWLIRYGDNKDVW